LHYVFLIVAIISEVTATTLLKMSNGWEKWWFGLTSCLFYAVAGLLLGFVLKSMGVGVAYAIWAGVGIAFVCVASVILWGQSFDLAALGGIALILGGILLITLKSSVVLQ